MSAKYCSIALPFALAFTSLLPAVSVAQRSPALAGATITITATSKKGSPPAVNQGDVQLSQGKDRKQIARWVKAERLSLAILIDDSLDSEVASQWGDVKQFIESLPPTTLVAVGYASNGSVRIAQDFDLICTTLHDKDVAIRPSEEKSWIAKTFGVQFDFKTGRHTKRHTGWTINDPRPVDCQNV